MPTEEYVPREDRYEGEKIPIERIALFESKDNKVYALWSVSEKPEDEPIRFLIVECKDNFDADIIRKD